MGTCSGASVLHKTKKIGVAVSSTHDAEPENIATVEGERGRGVRPHRPVAVRALGVPGATAPTLLLTDSLANQKVSQNAQSATRCRSHVRVAQCFLIQSACLHQRIADGEVGAVVHVPRRS